VFTKQHNVKWHWHSAKTNFASNRYVYNGFVLPVYWKRLGEDSFTKFRRSMNCRSHFSECEHDASVCLHSAQMHPAELHKSLIFSCYITLHYVTLSMTDPHLRQLSAVTLLNICTLARQSICILARQSAISLCWLCLMNEY
jgi:hypothetical protein